MIYVADTHAFVWWASGGKKLGKDSRRAFQRSVKGLDVVHLPAPSLFEIGLLLHAGRLRAPQGLDVWRSALRRSPGIVVEPFTEEDASLAAEFPQLVDPFDRMIAATAVRLGATLISADERIQQAGIVRTVW